MRNSKNSAAAANGKKKKKKKRNPIATFFRIVVSIVLIFIFLAGGAIMAYNKFGGGEEETQSNSSIPSFFDTLMGKGIKLNVAVFGVDGDETRTDVIFVVHFDSKAQKISLISVPRDTRVTLTDEIQEGLRENNRSIPSGGVCKINAVHAYGGKDHNCEYAVMQLEDLLGIKIDHYVKVNIDGFKKLVDAIGGVDIDVPQAMHYEDPFQDLYIHLDAGPQHLDGEKAEMLVRFRKYANADLGRVEVQHLFLEEFAKKVLSTSTILNNLPDLISTYFEYVTTDVNVADAIKYAQYADDINMENITMEMLPGAPQYIGGVSYYLCDEDATKEMVDKLFYGKGEENAGDVTDSKSKKIEVANGGNTEGLAAKKRDLLEKDGYTVVKISTYNGEKEKKTRIIVREDGIGQDLKTYFDDSEIVVDESLLDADTDIKIILGTGQK